MRNNPFVKNLDELLANIRNDVQNGQIGFYLANDSKNSVFEKLLVQELKREVNGQQVSFLAIRDVRLKEELRGNGYFKAFFEQLNELNIPLMFHDVLNERLQNFLLKHDYKIYKEVKNEQELTSCYKMVDELVA